jgi:hypothetical protein
MPYEYVTNVFLVPFDLIVFLTRWYLPPCKHPLIKDLQQIQSLVVGLKTKNIRDYWLIMCIVVNIKGS